MSRNVIRHSGVFALASIGLLIGTSAAVACPDADDAPGRVVHASIPHSCYLERIGSQFVRCDVLTGAGGRAPGFVPQQGSAHDWDS